MVSEAPVEFSDGLAEPQLARAFADIDAARREARVAGLSIVVLRRGDLPVIHTQGVTDLRTGEAVTAETRFAIGSLTKAFTAALALIAVDRGKLELDAHPRQCLEGFAVRPEPRDRVLTLRDMLAHTSATQRDSAVQILRGDRAQLVEQLQRMDPLRPEQGLVGSKMFYSNAMYGVAGVCIEHALGGPFEDLLGDEVLTPLGMQSAGFETRAGDAVGHVVQPADPTRGRPEHFFVVDDEGPSSGAPGGGLRLSAVDAIPWLAYWMNQGRTAPQLLRREQFAEAIRPRLPLDERGGGYGLGWGIANAFNRRIYSHSGKTAGQESTVAIFPDEGIAILVLTNGYHGRFRSVVRDRLAQALLGERVKAIELEPTQRAGLASLAGFGAPHELAGLYVAVGDAGLDDPPLITRVASDGAHLVVGVNGDEAQWLLIDDDARARSVRIPDGGFADTAPKEGRGWSILRDQKGRVEGLRRDEGSTWMRLRLGRSVGTKRVEAAARRAHGWDAYETLLPLAWSFEQELTWLGVRNAARMHADARVEVADGSWDAGPDLRRAWWSKTSTDRGAESLTLTGWTARRPPQTSATPLPEAGRVGLDPLGWVWEGALASEGLGRIELDQWGQLELVMHHFSHGQVLLDAYDASSGRLVWRRSFVRDFTGAMRHGLQVFESWTELEGVLLPQRVRLEGNGHRSVRILADHHARVPWEPGETEPPQRADLIPLALPIVLHPDAKRALSTTPATETGA